MKWTCGTKVYPINEGGPKCAISDLGNGTLQLQYVRNATGNILYLVDVGNSYTKQYFSTEAVLRAVEDWLAAQKEI